MSIRTNTATDRFAERAASSVETAARNYFSHDEVAATRKPWSAASSLPPRCYKDPDFYRLEEELIFRKIWMCVGRAEQIPEPGDYLTIDLLREPWIVVRGRDHQIRALSRICRHRWMPIMAEGTGRASSLLCPYHSWTYDLDGTLRAAPKMDRTQDFHCKQLRLPQLRCEQWKGFVFVNFDADAIPLATLLEPLDEVVANYQLESMRGTEFKDYPSTWNWKIMVENVSEVYHGVVHRDILGRPLAIPEVSYAEAPRNSVYSLHRIQPNAAGRSPLVSNFDPIPSLTERQLSEYLTVTIYPSTLIFFYPDQISLLQLLPQDMLRHTIRYVLCAPEKTRELPSFEKRFRSNKALTDLIHGQDMDVCERVQKGVNSEHAASYRFSHMEQCVWQFQNFILDKMLGETILPLG